MKNISFILILVSINFIRINGQVQSFKIYPDSIICDVTQHPTGINLNFLMDGGRFPHPKHSISKALHKMGVKYLRYPGGEKSDLYLFSIPPFKKSVPTLARTVALDDYPGMFIDGKDFRYPPLDFDQFIKICKSIDAEPVIVVAADNYLNKVPEGKKQSSREDLIRNAVEWVKYANIQKKYGVKYWMIGNECWNSNNPNSTPEIYARDVIDFSKAMKAIDPSILIIPNGDSEKFFETVIKIAGDYFDRLCVSNYGVYNFNSGYYTYRDTSQILIWPAMAALNAMNKFGNQEQLKKWKLIVAEWGTIDWAGLWKGNNDMGHALVAFDMAGQLLLQPQIEFSCFWNTRWIENESKPFTDHDALDKDGNLNATGLSLMIWGKFMGSQMVKSESTDSILTYSSYSPDKGILFIYLINKVDTSKKISFVLPNYKIKSIKESWELYGANPEDLHPVWQKKKIQNISDFTELKGTSITVIECNIKRIDN